METIRKISPTDPRWVTPNFESYSGNHSVYTKRFEDSYDFKKELDESIDKLRKEDLTAEAVVYETQDPYTAQKLYEHFRSSRNVFISDKEPALSVSKTKGERAIKSYRMSVFARHGEIQDLDSELRSKGLQRCKQSVSTVSIERNMRAKKTLYPHFA